jgi:hypothetical protein
MVKRVSKLKPLKLILTIAAMICMQFEELHAQVQFFTTPPDIDSFPVVKTEVSVAFNGKPAPFGKSNLSILEDGQPVTNFELFDCDESPTASIAVLMDVSESMLFTLFKGADEFYNSFPVFTSQMYAPTELALIPFNDTVTRIIPASYRAQDFFNAGDPTDMTEFVDSVEKLQFSGNTDVDYAVWRAAIHLKQGSHQRKAIVLITDDAIYDYPGLTALLKQENIALFVLELDGDTIRGNILTADATGGKFYSPKDSTQIGPMMADIAQDIFAKKCTLRYVSNHPCPWWSNKTLWIGLNYQNQKFAQTHYFDLGHNRTDSIAPILSDVAIDGLSRIVRADENFPCDRGIKTFTDSALVNFAKLTRKRALPQYGYDSVVVIDPSQAADGYYIATDSNGNTSRIRITYDPPPDTLAPVWTSPFRSAPGQYQLIASELRKWDRGLKSISLEATSSNVRIDSIIYVGNKLAKTYVSRIKATQPAIACLLAIDSVDNDSSTCLTFEISIGDTTPPVITQRAIASPFVSVMTDVTELRNGDRGLKSISILPISNIGNSTTTYASAFVADVNSPIMDSLYDAEALVTAVDSAGNTSQQTIWYRSTPDVLAPEYTVSVDDIYSRTVSISEKRGWDRGIRSVIVAGSFNISSASITEARRENVLRFTSIDPYTIATARIEAKDSAGNIKNIEVEIPAQIRPEILPLAYTDPLDFGTVAAPSSFQLSMVIINPNADPVTIVGGSWSGDDSVFSLAGILPSSFGPSGSQKLTFNFDPQLLGDWSAIYTIETDKGVKYPIRMKGSSTGAIALAMSEEQIATSGESGVLTIDISGSPDVSNLDTIQFSITLDDDVAILQVPSTTCAGADWVCNYSLNWFEAGKGKYDVQLLRKSKLQSLKLIDKPQLSIPFRTFLSGKLRTDVSVADIVASRSNAVSTPGGITIGQGCGDSIIVNTLSNERASKIVEVSTDHDQLRIGLEASINEHVSIKLIDLRGIARYEIDRDLSIGYNTILIPSGALSSGAYRIILSSETATHTRSVNILR